MPRKKQQEVAAPAAEWPIENDAGTSVDIASPERALMFTLAGQTYAIDAESVQEIQQIVALSDVSSSEGAVVGMLDLRGDVIPALDLRTLLGLPPATYDLRTPMIICRTHAGLVALLVDAVEDVIELPDGCLQDAPRLHPLSSKMRGVARFDSGLAYLLDVDLLVAEALCAVGPSR